MSPRTRFLAILFLTVLVIGAALGFMVLRASQWHEQGWTGMNYLFGPVSEQQMAWMGVGQYEVVMTVSGSPADGRLLYRDEILSLNGIPRDDVERLKVLDAKTRRGSTVVYRIRRGKSQLDVPLQFESPLRSRYLILRHIVALVVGLTFVAIGLLLIARAPGDSRATVFFALALLSAIAILGAAATVYEQSNARGIITSAIPPLTTFYLFSIAAFMYPPLILHLGLIFPRRRPILERNPIILRWIYVAAFMAVLSLLFSLVMMNVVGANDVAESEAAVKRFVKPIARALVLFGVFVALNILWAARREGVIRAIVLRPVRVSLGVVGLCCSGSRAGWACTSRGLRPDSPEDSQSCSRSLS